MIASMSKNPKDLNRYPEWCWSNSEQRAIFLKQLLNLKLFYYGPDLSLQSKFNLVTFFYSVLSQKVLHGYVETRWNVCIHPFFEWQRFKPRKDKKARISRTLNQSIVIFYRFPSFPIFFVTMQTFDEKFCCISRFYIPNNFYILNH